ncbi:MAG: hypothetical protein K8T10_06670 [Candidatus Eremiobacteraeota bacterium]|nr:hypothetical protein [Candidatus Eremiobacteraeota bacterium]
MKKNTLLLILIITFLLSPVIAHAGTVRVFARKSDGGHYGNFRVRVYKNGQYHHSCSSIQKDNRGIYYARIPDVKPNVNYLFRVIAGKKTGTSSFRKFSKNSFWNGISSIIIPVTRDYHGE